MGSTGVAGFFSRPPGGSQLHYWGASRVFLWCPLPAWGTPHLSFRRPSPAPEGGRGRRGNLVRPPERKLFRRLSFCHRISQVMAPGPAPFGPLPLSNPSSPQFIFYTTDAGNSRPSLFALEGPFYLPLRFPLLDGPPLVVELFPPGQADLHLGPALFEIEPEGDEGVSLG